MKNNRPIRDTIVAVDSNKKKVDNTKTIDKEKIKEELELKKDAKEDIPVEEGLTSDETVKLKKLEEQMRTLYDRVNDVVNDLDYDDSGVFDIDLLSEEIEKSNIDNNQKKKYKFKNLKFNKINEKISDIGGETINKISGYFVIYPIIVESDILGLLMFAKETVFTNEEKILTNIILKLIENR